VIDLRRGRAVHARGGRRDRYAPVVELPGARIDGDAAALTRRYRDLGVLAVYVADLDAIEGGAPQDALVAAIAEEGVPLWLDAGVASGARAQDCLSLRAERVVVGLETLPSWAALHEVCAAVGGERVAFSLDLRNGAPVAAETIAGAPEHLAKVAVDAGVRAVIVLDLARIGQAAGIDVTLIARIRAAAPGVTLVAGGGVRDHADLRRLRDAGCDAALVATALHTGTLRGGHASVRR
jgi:phosphoribosylformimino-5-aminoimidazole carboxamide ribotide isomerase